jgi:spore coat polysaccharide biosynthesis protein SpsF
MLAAIIQAAMDSTRLPEKTLIDISGKPMLWHLIDRVKRVKEVDKVIIATTQRECDMLIRQFAVDQNIPTYWYEGGREDVIERVYLTAKVFQADAIMRVTPDCPLVDPKVMSKVAQVFLENGFDYVGNVHPARTYPKGLDVEIFSFECLEHLHTNAKTEEDREGWNPYLLRNYKRYMCFNVVNELADMGHHHWCVDTKEDLEFVRKIFDRLYIDGQIFSMWDVMEVLASEVL